MGSLAVTFDPTITFGAVFIILSQIGSIVWFAARVDKSIALQKLEIETLTKRVDSLAADIKENSKIGERFATLEGRVTNHASLIATTQRDVSDLRRGDGFIREHVQGEWPGT